MCKIWDLTAVSMKFAFFWDMTECNFIDGYQHFGGTKLPPTLHHLEGGGSRFLQKGWYLFAKLPQHLIPEDCNICFQTYREFVIMLIHLTNSSYDKEESFDFNFLCVLCTIQKSSSSSISVILDVAFYWRVLWKNCSGNSAACNLMWVIMMYFCKWSYK